MTTLYGPCAVQQLLMNVSFVQVTARCITSHTLDWFLLVHSFVFPSQDNRTMHARSSRLVSQITKGWILQPSRDCDNSQARSDQNFEPNLQIFRFCVWQ